MKKSLFVTMSVLLISTLVLAQTKAPTARSQKQQRSVSINAGTQCGQDPILPTDGSATDDYVFPGTPSWYLVHLKAGHSYSVEVWDPIDPVIGGSAALAMIATDCTTTIPTTDVTTVDPDLSNSFGARVSWIQAADNDAYVQLNTSDPSGNAYTIRVTDTTLYNQRWSTFGGFQTQYSFVNNSEFSISGTLTIYGTAGNLVNTVPVTVPALNQFFYIFSTPVNKVGYATFAFVGPAGSITADAYFLNSGATVVVPTKFEVRNYQH